MLESYANEIELLKKLNGSPHIIELVDYEINRDQMFVAMLLEPGDIDLAKVLGQKHVGGGSNQPLLNPFFARMVWREMLEAVNHIHDNRIVHGDLKPANFVFVKGHLKLIDFGIAKSFNSDTTNIYRESQIGTVITYPYNINMNFFSSLFLDKLYGTRSNCSDVSSRM